MSLPHLPWLSTVAATCAAGPAAGRRSPRWLAAPLLPLLLAACQGPASVAKDTPPAAATVAAAPAAAAEIVLAAPPTDWAMLAGQAVRIAAPLTLIDGHGADKDGSVVASFGGRQWQPTERAVPGSAQARAIAADNTRRRLVLDVVAGDATALAAARTGSGIADVRGTVSLRDGTPRLRLATPIRLQAIERPAAPTVAGDVRIAALNLENFFNGDGVGGGFPTARGARTPAQFARQRDKLVATLRALDPDIAALMELENDGHGRESSLAQLVAALNAGGDDWRFVTAPAAAPAAEPIRVGLVYRAGRVRPVGRAASLAAGPFGSLSRPPLAQAFRAGKGPAFVVVANHFKSKGCSGAEGVDRDQQDAQGCWTATRVESARRLDAWLQQDPTASRSQHALIIGDLNAYGQEDPVRALHASGWRDAFAVTGGETPYSYQYRGLSGRLDHALLSPTLAARLRGAVEWHSNADEPEAAGYEAGGEGPWRSSDHDPLLLGFDLRR